MVLYLGPRFPRQCLGHYGGGLIASDFTPPPNSIAGVYARGLASLNTGMTPSMGA